MASRIDAGAARSDAVAARSGRGEVWRATRPPHAVRLAWPRLPVPSPPPAPAPSPRHAPRPQLLVDPSDGVAAVVNAKDEEDEKGDGALELGEYSGFILKGSGDGKRYTLIVRTAQFDKDGLEYHHDFPTRKRGFTNARLPFTGFVAYRVGKPLGSSVAPELARRNIVGIAVGFFPQRNARGDAGDGQFYLSLARIKAYRERDEPEIVSLDAPLAPPNPRSSARACCEAVVARGGLTRRELVAPDGALVAKIFFLVAAPPTAG